MVCAGWRLIFGQAKSPQHTTFDPAVTIRIKRQKIHLCLLVQYYNPHAIPQCLLVLFYRDVDFHIVLLFSYCALFGLTHGF